MEWSLWEVSLAVVAGLLVGFSKTGVPAAGLFIVPIMAFIFPAKLSVGILLPMLIVGDIWAVKHYRHYADHGELTRLAPGVLVGMVAGAFFLSGIDNETMEQVLGALVLLLLALEGLRTVLPAGMLTEHRIFPWVFGALAGAATTMGNAAGPLVSLYLLSRSLPKESFMGTAAWFFLVVNCLKVPLFAYLGIITLEGLIFDAALIPMILLGGWLGVAVLPRISQSFFNRLILVLSAVVGLQLIIGF
uniref:Probable membrane transporter protein n=1 Tax=Candidatus Kentrum eta TaxID=2126337 RepID=A0A450UJM3_9GAMM|nr:MAG: hypothetical protein BECKH772A_GA0070896_1004711 [Candidatus Kentron sp. H]VFJ93261.1 MAG: hypothetical protein BECKH772B_GA0070898_100416 [Candidatus Kentron sp. H]VFK00451.1 MAG: hypothetical protein BECKH772C_GA0070978_1004611 [Candidatus Kentron sp. H]